MDRWKSRGGKSQRREEKRRSEKRKSQKKEDAGARKCRKVAIHCVFALICAPRASKSSLAKGRVRSHLARWEMKNCTPLWREARFEIKNYNAHHSRSIFGSWNIEKVHALVARSTCRSQSVQSTSVSEHFWKLTCPKGASRCGANHISTSKCTKHLDHFWRFRCGFAWRAQGILYLTESEQNVRVL